MPRRLRFDTPGAWHHVMNRGLSKRAVFLGLPEIRYFQARLAREVQRERIEVHSYCFMTTHFHLLLRSPRAELSSVMQRVLNAFVRWFNRKHRRDGPLFRARFTSHHVQSDVYRRNVLRYIDQNPVSAKLVRSAEEYPHGSAHFCALKRSPLWFGGQVPASPGPMDSSVQDQSHHAAWVIERRLEKRTFGDPLDELLAATTSQVRAWMERKARLADGTSPGSCLLSPRSLRQAIEGQVRVHGAWMVAPSARKKDAWSILEAGMSRDMIGQSVNEVALGMGIARSTAGHALLQHRQLMLADSTYSKRAAVVLQAGLLITFGA